MHGDLEKHRPLAIVLLRIMGLYLLIQGLSGVFGQIYEAIVRYKSTVDFNQTYFENMAMDPTVISWIMTDTLRAAFGAYLIRYGKIAIDMIFHDSITYENDSEGDISET